jgi:large subunit ribosomal protein L35Ae
MKGRVIQFRKGRHTIHVRHFLIDVGAEGREKAEKFVGKEVEWISPAGKIIHGKISSPHGNRGLVRAIFEKGLPGQALTQEVSVLTSEIKIDKSEKKHETKRESEIKGGGK